MNKLIFPLLLCLLLFPKIDYAQHLTTDQLIKAWSYSDTSQTTRAELTYADLKKNIQKDILGQRVQSLNNYLEKHPDQRLKVRLLMYEILAKRQLGFQVNKEDIEKLKHAITIANLLNDQQLLSEAYTLYAIYSQNNKQNTLFYYLRS